MSMIVPAGNNKLDWSPKATKLQKTASGGQEAQDIEIDALYEAAKSVVAANKEDKKCEKCEDCKCDPCICKDKKDKKQEKEAGAMCDDDSVVLEIEEVQGDGLDGASEDMNVVEEVSTEAEPRSVSEAVAEVEAKADEAEAVVEEISLAVEKIEEAVEGVKAVCGKGKDGEAVADEEAIVETDKVPGEEVVDSEVIVEGEEASMDKSASSEEFCKYAKLSPQNRKKLNDYWTNMLGYPKDFVNLMTKDYEK